MNKKINKSKFQFFFSALIKQTNLYNNLVFSKESQSPETEKSIASIKTSLDKIYETYKELKNKCLNKYGQTTISKWQSQVIKVGNKVGELNEKY